MSHFLHKNSLHICELTEAYTTCFILSGLMTHFLCHLIVDFQNRAARIRVGKGDKPVTYEQALAPHHIGHRKGWLSQHTSESQQCSLHVEIVLSGDSFCFKINSLSLHLYDHCVCCVLQYYHCFNQLLPFFVFLNSVFWPRLSIPISDLIVIHSCF